MFQIRYVSEADKPFGFRLDGHMDEGGFLLKVQWADSLPSRGTPCSADLDKIESKEASVIGKYKVPVLIWLVFEAVAVTLWLALHNVFYFFNFTYIGTALAVGLDEHIRHSGDY